MGTYDAIVPRFERLLRKLQSTSTANIRASLPDVPEDYLEFLREVGWGEIGESNYMLYEAPVPISEIFPELSGIWLIGDDLAGYSAGFDEQRDWVIVELDPSGDRRDAAPTFQQFIRQKLERLPN